jgi:hypothetical protein
MLDVVADSVILLNCFYIAFYILQVFKAVGATSWGLGYQIAAHGAAWSARRIPHRNLTPRARPRPPARPKRRQAHAPGVVQCSSAPRWRSTSCTAAPR